jgi:hypothetical protein
LIFKDPFVEYRGVPFYSLNDTLDPDKIREHLKKIKEAGFGGVFFHAREGLATPFLSEEWFNAFSTAVKEAESLGIKIWIYDEDRWPSGTAGGLVASEKSSYAAKALIMIIDNKSFFGENTLAVFRCEYDDKILPRKCEMINRSEGSSRYIYLSFIRHVASPGDVWFSGFYYTDLLDPDVVKRFIEIAMKPYLERFREYIGNVVPGVFTDEPNIHDSRPRFPVWWKKISIPPRGSRFPIYAVPWTDRFREYFAKINGYDILEKLPELFFDIGDYVKTRYDFWKTITRLFVESFSKQIYEWCDLHKLMFTGHYLAEDDLLSQMVVGSVMPHYEYMHVPGIDHLGLQIWGSLLTAKQVSSVAEQLERKRVLSETYGCLGNYGSFEDRKWIGDFLYVLGINLLNHHLIPYSLRGRRKADYGLNIHWGQPWWRYNRYIEDYFSRLSYVLSQGRRVVEVLIIHPIYSVWSTYTPVNDKIAREINDKYLKLLKEFTKIHVDFELGDEMIIERHGDVDKNFFVIGAKRYKYVILPPMINIGGRTLELLKRFNENNGIIIAVERLPEYVDGVKKDVSKELRDVIIIDKIEDLKKFFERQDLMIKIFSDDVDGNILYHAREVDQDLVLFIVNVDREKEHYVEISVRGSYDVERWDPFTGSIFNEMSEYKEERTWIRKRLLPAHSVLFVLKPSKEIHKIIEKRFREKTLMRLSGEWQIYRKDPNMIVLDYAQVYIERDNVWSDPMPLPRIRDEYMSNNIGSKILLRYSFHIKNMPEKDLELIIEKTEVVKKLAVNGHEIDLSKPVGSWIDPVFMIYKISRDLLREGENHVEIEYVSSLEPELEPIYMRGDFGVELINNDKTPMITMEKKSVLIDHGVNLVKEGYPFYSGEISLIKRFSVEKRDGEKIILRIKGLEASLAILKINGREVNKIINRYSETDATEYLTSGENVIELLLVSSLRNILGPLHRKDPIHTAPETFYIIDNTWSDSYILRPLGFEEISLITYEEER